MPRLGRVKLTSLCWSARLSEINLSIYSNGFLLKGDSCEKWIDCENTPQNHTPFSVSELGAI